jgi:CheY-like chemotaxis protein
METPGKDDLNASTKSKQNKTSISTSPASRDEQQPQHRSKGLGLQYLIPQTAGIAKAAAWLVLLLFVVSHWSYFGNWLGNATHVEFPGVKIDRFVEASARVQEYAATPKAKDSNFNLQFARAAIVRAERVSPAIKGALVLWVDNNPDNNRLEVEILKALGIRFVTALSTKEAMERLERDSYDLIISNVGRDDPPTPLKACPVHYFDFQTDQQRNSFDNNLDAFNARINAAPPGGFSLMEQVKGKYKGAAPPMIFFTFTSGEKVATLCSKTITKRVDFLLQSVVSNLEERRWQALETDTASPNATAGVAR